MIFVFSGKAHPARHAGHRHAAGSDPPHARSPLLRKDILHRGLQPRCVAAHGSGLRRVAQHSPPSLRGLWDQRPEGAVNAGVNLSISDGWWCEGYNGENGWTIGPAVTREYLCGEQSDYDDAGFLYALLEEKIVPLYFERNFEGMPHDWLLTVRQSMQSLIARFSSNRWVRSISTTTTSRRRSGMRNCATSTTPSPSASPGGKQDVNARFSSLRIEQIRIEGLKGEELMGTQPMPGTDRRPPAG